MKIHRLESLVSFRQINMLSLYVVIPLKIRYLLLIGTFHYNIYYNYYTLVSVLYYSLIIPNSLITYTPSVLERMIKIFQVQHFDLY